MAKGLAAEWQGRPYGVTLVAKGQQPLHLQGLVRLAFWGMQTEFNKHQAADCRLGAVPGSCHSG